MTSYLGRGCKKFMDGRNCPVPRTGRWQIQVGKQMHPHSELASDDNALIFAFATMNSVTSNRFPRGMGGRLDGEQFRWILPRIDNVLRRR